MRSVRRIRSGERLLPRRRGRKRAAALERELAHRSRRDEIERVLEPHELVDEHDLAVRRIGGDLDRPRRPAEPRPARERILERRSVESAADRDVCRAAGRAIGAREHEDGDVERRDLEQQADDPACGGLRRQDAEAGAHAAAVPAELGDGLRRRVQLNLMRAVAVFVVST